METAREVLPVLVVFALLGAALWTLRRGGLVKFRAMRVVGLRRLEPIERRALTPHHALHLVRIGGREVVVATHPQGCALLIENNNGEAR